MEERTKGLAAVLPGISAGLVAGLRTVIGCTALAALIFSSDLAASLPEGVALLLFSGFILSLSIAWFSSYAGTVAQPQDGAAAIGGLMAASLVVSLPPGMAAQDKVLCVLVAIAMTTLLVGVLFCAMGYLKLGALVRFIPYPVIGGFLAGSGWLFVKGSFAVMAGAIPMFDRPDALFQPHVLAVWLPGSVFAVALLLALRRWQHYLLVPCILFGAAGLFYAALFFAEITVAEAGERGWLLGPFAEGGNWRPLVLLDIARVDWRALLAELPKMVTVAGVSIIGLMLNATGLELATKQEMDINHELRAAGLANIWSGLFGGLAGYHALSASLLGQRMGANSRLIGMITAAMCLAAMVAGPALVSFVPKLLLGGLLLFMGLAFLVEWLYDARARLPRVDYAIVLLIVVTISGIGYMEGVALGIVAATVIFVVKYSSVRVVRQALSGAEYHSNVDRSPRSRAVLSEAGDQTFILCLDGYLFFGTANGLVEEVKKRLAAAPPLRFLLMDFRRVVGVDSSAVSSFSKIRDIAWRAGCTLVFSDLSPALKSQLRSSGYDIAEDDHFHIFRDLDHALEWCEECILGAHAGKMAADADDIRQLLGDAPEALLRHLEPLSFERDDFLIRQGEKARDLFFIESGRVAAQLEFGNGNAVRLRAMERGAVVGEIAWYLGQNRSASVVAVAPTRAFRLTAEKLALMEKTEPAAASAFHRLIARALAQRLDATNRLLTKVLD